MIRIEDLGSVTCFETDCAGEKAAPPSPTTSTVRMTPSTSAPEAVAKKLNAVPLLVGGGIFFILWKAMT